MRRAEAHDWFRRWLALPLALAVPYAECGNPAREEAGARPEGVVYADFIPEVYIVISIESRDKAVKNWPKEARPFPGFFAESVEFVDA